MIAETTVVQGKYVRYDAGGGIAHISEWSTITPSFPPAGCLGVGYNREAAIHAKKECERIGRATAGDGGYLEYKYRLYRGKQWRGFLS